MNIDDTCFLFDSFAFYYRRGFSFFSEQEFHAMRNNLIHAAEILLEIAKKSNGVVKAQRLVKAKNIYALVDRLSTSGIKSSNTS